MIEIVTDKKFLKQKFELSDNPEKTLTLLKNNFIIGKYIGLAAPQIGIKDRVAVIYWEDEWIDIIDWKIEHKLMPFIHRYESCLSLPNMAFATQRYRQISFVDHFGNRYASYFADEEEKEIFNTSCITYQHEIDHFDGVLLEDIALETIDIMPPRQVIKVGRNDPCPCGSGKKYKKCCIDNI